MKIVAGFAAPGNESFRQAAAAPSLVSMFPGNKYQSIPNSMVCELVHRHLAITVLLVYEEMLRILMENLTCSLLDSSVTGWLASAKSFRLSIARSVAPAVLVAAAAV
eukprot:scpid29271/ scgid11287/ 